MVSKDRIRFLFISIPLLMASLLLLSLSSMVHGKPEKRGIGLSKGITAKKIVTVQTPQGEEIKLYKDSFALLIGVSKYSAGWPKLAGVVDDIKTVAEELKNHGFSVVVVWDPDDTQLRSAFSQFINQYGMDPQNRLLFYYAGHGHTEKQAYGEEMGYIIPINAPNPEKDKNRFLQLALDMQQIEVYAKRIQSKHALFLFDSCFSGSIFAISRAIPKAISYKTSKPVRQFITSGSANETVPDKSIFRDQFVAALQGEADQNNDGFLTGTELGIFLETTVINYSRDNQHPQYGKIRNRHLDKGDFVFQIEGHISATKTTAQKPLEVETKEAPRVIRKPELPGNKLTSPAKSRVTEVYMKGGEYIMGNDHSLANEKPAHKVRISSFFIDTHEVSFAQYRRCVQAGVCKRSALDRPPYNGADQPVVGINWKDANTYCQWAGRRLPTEAEWEYVLKVEGNMITSPSEFEIGKISWFRDNSSSQGHSYAHAVGSKEPKPANVYDMLGNVSEWVEDWYGKYRPANQNFPKGPSFGTNKVLRGGDWSTSPSVLSATYRARAKAASRKPTIGFRCAK